MDRLYDAPDEQGSGLTAEISPATPSTVGGRLRLVESPRNAARAIVQYFPANYVQDTLDILQARNAFYEAQGNRSILACAIALAEALMRVLEGWGLKRNFPAMPGLRDKEDVVRCLRVLREPLAKLAELSMNPPRLHGRKRVAPGPLYTPDELDQAVLTLLLALADGVFKRCTQATYVMKALLLLTGYTVAFDGRVKKGATLAGLRGMYRGFPVASIRESSTTYASLAILTLPYLVGEAWYAEPEVFEELIAEVGRHSAWASVVSMLLHPARLFDILLFVQGKHGLVLLRYEGTGGWPWYESLDR
ncbi:hypothetical protein [Cupriavidus sp. CuC1]|uniref:hypothetical protein n=1 Tax=Cupriavidus sp. CuC1 TaxID=3373131 RepID=UPI0037CFF82F